MIGVLLFLLGSTWTLSNAGVIPEGVPGLDLVQGLSPAEVLKICGDVRGYCEQLHPMVQDTLPYSPTDAAHGLPVDPVENLATFKQHCLETFSTVCSNPLLGYQHIIPSPANLGNLGVGHLLPTV